MPLYPPNDPSLTFEPVTLPDGFSVNPEPHEGPRPSFGQTLGAGFEIDNEVLGAIKGLDRENNFGDVDPGHNPWEQIEGTELEPYGDAFLGSRNQKHTDYIASAIREEIRNRKIIEASHPLTAFIASGIASLASPTTLLPGGVIYRGLKVGRAAAKSAAAVGAANAAAAGIQEGILHSQQYTRTGTESAFAVGGSFLLAGILGGAVSGMSSHAFRKLTTKLETDLQMPRAIDQEMASMAGAGQSAGAAAVAKPPADLKSAFGLEKFDLLGPSGRGMNSDFPSMREFTAEGVELPTMTTRNALGITTAPRGGSIETRIKTQGEAKLGEAVSIADNAWKSYRFGKDNPSFSERIGAIGKKPAGKLSEREFRQEVGKALVRNDTHAIPEVQKAARDIRKAVIQPIAEDAIKLKKLDLVEVTKNLPNWLKNEMKPQQSGGADPTAGMDANLRVNIDGMLSRVEELTGQKIAPEQRKAAMAAVAGNEGLLSRLREIFYGDADVPFALRDAGSRAGRSMDRIVDDLEDGYPVSMDRELIDTVLVNLADIRLGLPATARNVPMHAFVGVEPVGKIRFDGQDVDGVSVSFRGVDGGFRSVELPIDIFRRARAFSLDGEVFVVTSEIVGQFDKRLAGEVRHELFHALRAKGLIPDDVLARLAAHANSLQILDMPYRAFADAIGDDAARSAGPASLKKIYQNLYANSTAERLSSILDEEAGAHMVELWSHGKLTDEQLAPVMDDLVAMFGRPVPAGEGLKRIVDEWVGRLHGAIKVDGDGGVRFAMRGSDADTGRSMHADPDPIAIDKLETPTSGMRGKGFALFHLTDKVKRSVVEDGQPLFALRDLSRRIDAPLVDDLGKSDPHPGRVMALHGTRAQSFDRFDAAKSRDFGIHFGTSSQADIPAGFTTTRENARMFPVVLDLKTVVDVPDLMVWPPVEVAEAVERAYPLAGGMTDRVRAAIVNHGGVDVGPTGSTRPSREALAAGKDELRQLMTSANIDGLRYWNEAEGEGWSYIVWDQGKVTSATSGEPMFAMRGDMRGDDILKKIRDLGGIKDETGDLSNMGAGERRGLINNETGLSPDVMREHLVQQGYLQDVQFDDVTESSVNDLYDLIDNALRDNGGHGRVYRDEMASQALRAVQDSLAKNGIEIKLTPEQEDAVVKMILDQRMSVDDAAEAIGMPPRGDGAAPDGKPKATSDPMRDVNARRIMQEIEDLLDDGAEDGVFSSATADEVWADGGESYGPRVWDRPRIIAQRPTVKAIIADYFGEAQARAKDVLNRLMRDKRKLAAQAAVSGKPPKMPADMMKDIDELVSFTSLSRHDLESTADQVIDHIIGLQDGRMMTALPKSVRGSLKARTFHIPELFESASGRIEDFMDRDINVMMRQYVRSTVPDLEIIRRFGALDLQEQFARIGDDFKRLVDRLNLPEQKRASMTPEQIAKHERMAERERKRLDKARRNAERDLVGMVSRLRGERMDHMDPTAITTRAMRGVRQWNLITMLGGMTISALPDIFRPMMVHGVRSYFMDGLRPLLTNIQAVKKAGAEIKTFGTALDMELNTRLQAFADVVDDYGRYSKFERGLGYATEKFGVLSLMNAWNSSLKRVAGMMSMNNILRMAQNVANGTASKADIERLAAANIDAFDARIIADQFAKHGAVDGGVYMPNTKAWDAADPNIRAALDSFKGAIVRDVDRTIVTPGQEKPLFMSTEVGATLMQFKTFGVSSYQRTLVAGLQQRDSGVILGALLSVGMGMVVEHIKSLTNDKPLPKSDAQWIAAGLDRSGLLAYFSDVNNLVEKGSGGTLGIGALTGKELSRYASRNAMDALLGPSVGRGADIFAVTSGFSRALAGKDQVRESDIATFRRLIPFQNLFYLSYIFQKLEQATSRGIGAKPSKHRSPLMDRMSSNTYLDEIINVA